jgi:hypothetical protein
LVWLVWRWGSQNYLLGLTYNGDPPNLSLPSRLGYRCELLLPGIPIWFCQAGLTSQGPLHLVNTLFKSNYRGVGKGITSRKCMYFPTSLVGGDAQCEGEK